MSIVARPASTGTMAIAITVVACGASVVTTGETDPGSGGAGGEGPTTVVSTTSFNPGGAGAGGIPENCQTFDVEVPAEGVPADAAQICAVVMGPVESNTAARVTLHKSPVGLHLAQGTLEVETSLLTDIVGLPSISVESSPNPDLLPMTVSNVSPTSSGFVFEASWPEPLLVQPDEFFSMMVVRTTFELACPNGMTKQVTALTHINLCDDDVDVAWVSSGDECTICGIIAEMAPSPIVPDVGGDDVGLGQVIRLRPVVVARIGRSVLVLAEHDGGDGVDYQWVPSGGEMREVAPDLVLWTPEHDDGSDVMQVAVSHADAAAVASYTHVLVAEAGLVA